MKVSDIPEELFHEFMDTLAEIWGTDIAYQEDASTVNCILRAMYVTHLRAEAKCTNALQNRSQSV